MLCIFTKNRNCFLCRNRKFGRQFPMFVFSIENIDTKNIICRNHIDKFTNMYYIVKSKTNRV